MKKLVWLHLFPLVLALITVGVFYEPLLSLYGLEKKTEIFSSDDLKQEKRFLKNYNQSAENEIQVARSLARKNQLTIFGSSELAGGERPGLANNFLPDSLGIPVLAIGHGYHELFAIYCELLYFRRFLPQSKIHIVLSPGWFEDGKGTLPQSFLEYVPPHFISHVVNDTLLPAHHLKYLAKSYDENYSTELSGKRLEYKYLEAYNRNIPSNSEVKKSLFLKHHLMVSDDGIGMANSEKKWKKWLSDSKLNSLKSLNDFFIDSSYFKKYVSDQKGDLKLISVGEIPHKNNSELADLKKILELTKEQNCDISFVMQPLNPYHYYHLNNYQPLMDSIEGLMAEFELTENYLNLFVTTKEEYEPGILTDVMHFSDYGWMKVNQFLYERHFNN